MAERGRLRVGAGHRRRCRQVLHRNQPGARQDDDRHRAPAAPGRRGAQRGEVELSEARWFEDLARVERWLDAAPQNTSVLTYNGFGGRIPASYRLRRSVRVDGNWLRLWTKRRSGGAEGFFIEVDDVVISNLEVEALEERVREDNLALVQALLDRPVG